MPITAMANDKEGPQVSVTHPQVKYILEALNSLYHWNLSIVQPLTIKGSAHSFEPSIRDLKNIFSQRFLIAGPQGHQPWLNHSKTNLPKNTLFLPSSNNEHFWLDKNLGCKNEKAVIGALKAWGLIQHDEPKNNSRWCDKLTKQVKELGEVIKRAKVTHAILAHNAISPLLKTLGLKVLVLYTDDHHAKVTAGKLKSALGWQRNKVISKHLLQISEPENSWPAPLRNSEERVLQWSPLKKDSLQNLINLLKDYYGAQN